MSESISWINPKLSLDSSVIEGHGYFANQNISKDELLIVQGGRCLHVSEIDDTELENYAYHGFQVEKEIYIFPHFINDEVYLDGIFKINHSCEPNAGFKGQISLVSIRDITKGEEIFFDYAMTDIEFDDEKPWEDEICQCGTKSCRKKITGHDWKLPDIRERYKNYFSVHVANSIAAESLNR